MQAEEKDYFKLLAYNLFSYAIDSNSSFKEVYTKKYGITDEQFVNQCKMFLAKINQGNIENNSVNANNVFASVLHSCIVGILSKVDITNEYIVNYELDKYAKNIVSIAKAITRELASDYSSSKRFVDKGNAIVPKIKAIMDKDYDFNDLNVLIKDLVSTGLFKIERKYSSPYSNEMSNMLVNTDTGDETNADYTRVDLIKRWLSRSYEGGILRLYARIVKPFVIDAKGRRFDNLNGNGSGIAEDFVKEAKAKGCDGIIIYNVVDGNMREANEYIVFSPNQVKSAYDNNGDYSLVSDNMYECIKK